MCRDWLFVLSDCGRMTGHSEVTRSISEQGALFRINVENRDYHHQSRNEIDGGKRIYQHVSDFLQGIDRGVLPSCRPTAQRPDNLFSPRRVLDRLIPGSRLPPFAKSDSSSSKAGLCKSRSPGAMARSVFKRAVKMGIKEVRKFITGRAMENP